MNFIKECFVENCNAFEESLKSIGFSNEQAVNFLPEAAMHIAYAVHKTGVFQTLSHLNSQQENQLTRSINVSEMANKSGMNTDMIALGFRAITPVLLQAYTQKADRFAA